MIEPKYRRKNNAWWRGRKVITKEQIANEVGVIGAGVVCTVTYKYGGLTIRTDICQRCHVALKVSRVSYTKLYRLSDRVELQKEKAIERAKKERTLDDAMGVVKWNGRYLVLPQTIADASPYLPVFGCGFFPI